MKLYLSASGSISESEHQRNVALAHSLGLPRLEPFLEGPLAVVGGGPSILSFEDEILAWDGPVWAINGAWAWCNDRGVDATFYTVDPHLQSVEGPKRAVLASCCAPALFNSLTNSEVRLFDLLPSDGPTSAVSTARTGILAGASSVTYFGCDSSYAACGSHAYMNEYDDCWLTARVGTQCFVTDAEMVLQAEWLSRAIREFPMVYRERSGGLLRALLAHPEWEAEEMSSKLFDSLVYLPEEHPSKEMAHGA